MIIRKMGAAVAAGAAGLALLMAPAAASAEPAQVQQVRAQAAVDCFVDVDRANFRDEPWGRILGSVGRGQGFNARDWADGWYVGELWGDPQRRTVWMHYSVLSYPCGD
ncbi:hypothetical protein ACFOWZ_31765 [Lentzea rhizosphaerae]|uniref:Uncharacterized protein n=1 Tax=Lentzea rhizosphaerae TaxID=2041025 RepID=A0ABV8C263_9PSEU